MSSKPIRSPLFAGLNGVGKTEIAKALATEMGLNFHRFDMSEFSDKHLVSGFTGDPLGYVDYEEGRLLVDVVKKHPHSAILFDEIEKAHGDIFNVFLRIMENATITDENPP